MAASCDDLLISGVDDFSDADITVQVERLNLLIDNLITGILVSNDNFRTQEEIQPIPGEFLHEALKNFWLSAGDARELLVEFVLRNLICSLLYSHFFEGEVFSAVGSGDLKHSLECMMDKLVSGGELNFFKSYFVAVRFLRKFRKL
jgi:hypothetical protein